MEKFYKRKLNLVELLKKKSFFLFGPRSTGKSSLIQHQLKQTSIIIDLLKYSLYATLSENPENLEKMILAEGPDQKIIVIDEIQKIPPLLDEVHRLIETYKWTFLLTGSSARKLKSNAANLLAGRAWRADLFPLCYKEIPDFDLNQYLRYGGLPQVYTSSNKKEELNAYVQTYLKEEIQAEGLIRKLPPFSRFLKMSALNNGNVLNYTEIASDAQVPPSTVREYYSMLQDTLVGFLVEPWIFSKKRKAIQTAKFYFFDTGVTHTLAGTQTLDRNSDLYGTSFEQFIAMELRAYLSYTRSTQELCYWRSVHGQEVDFLIGDKWAIEVKASSKIHDKHLKGLKALQEENIFENYFLVSHDPVKRIENGVLLIHWKEFLEKLWKGELILVC